MRYTALLAAAATACCLVAAARLPLSPFPTPSGGLNATRKLFLLEQNGLSAADNLLASTLQGVTSRVSPQMYRAKDVLKPATSSYALWLSTTATLFDVALDRTYLADLPGLLKALAPGLDGYVLANADDASTNTAAAVCAARRAVAVTTANEATAIAAGLTMLFDVRGRDTAWALATFNGTAGFSYSRNVTVIQDYAKAGSFMTDFSVASAALQWWDAGMNTSLAGTLLRSMRPGFAALGWGPDEIGTVSNLSRAGGAMIASDWAQNVDVLSAFDIPAFTQKPSVPLPPPAKQQHTVSFLMSDGDNIQFDLGGFAMASDTAHFGSVDRGSVSMGWTLSPALAELAPGTLSYLYTAASNGSAPGGPAPPNTDGRDLFVGSVSGFG